jgi:hypothetical protein
VQVDFFSFDFQSKPGCPQLLEGVNEVVLTTVFCQEPIFSQDPDSGLLFTSLNGLVSSHDIKRELQYKRLPFIVIQGIEVEDSETHHKKTVFSVAKKELEKLIAPKVLHLDEKEFVSGCVFSIWECLQSSILPDSSDDMEILFQMAVKSAICRFMCPDTASRLLHEREVLSEKIEYLKLV